ncbi:MAG: CehA/McbA family metallohydrolase [Bdellovibrionales bacterium]|nr:CehA/McbA family metallohydrolase [Bdellovibrionales bacterium]
MKLILSLLFILFSFELSFAFDFQDKLEIENRVQKAMNKLDATVLSQSLDDTIITAYQQILHLNPSKIELMTIRLLLTGYDHEAPMNISHFIEQLFVVKSQKDQMTYEYVSQNIDLIENLNLNLAPLYGVYKTRQLNDVEPQGSAKLKPLYNTSNYNVYYGYLHSHSGFSDGKGTPNDAYYMAKFTAKLDFFALTDHSEFLHFWPWTQKYKKIRRAARDYNEDGRFTALHGFEWSHPLLGHFNVINSNSYTSAIIRPTMGFLMSWLSRRPHAFGRFNHPGRENMKYWPYEFSKLKLYPKAIKNVVGIEMWNKRDNLDEYINKRQSFMKNHNFLDNANLNGWFVGAVGGQDNHDRDWGIRNDRRVGVWSTGLTRQEIVQAYFDRRTFATDDKNAWLSFKINGAEMGSRLQAGNYKFQIKFGDKDNETFKKIKLVKSGHVIKEYIIKNTNSLTGSLPTELNDYFYVVAEQEDGDKVLSSPIWIVQN